MNSHSAERDPLIGRERELQLIAAALESGRLVSLTGPGGSGKTRLANAAVQAAVRGGSEAWFVDASNLRDAEFLGSAILGTIGLTDVTAAGPTAVIAEAFAQRHALLALDNLEQVKGAGAAVSDLLDAAPTVRLVTTSRVPLNVAGEVTVPVPMLQVPSSNAFDEIAKSAAGRLFLTRARAVGFTVDPDGTSANDIAELLRRLDGLPLAIELAAARTRVLSPQQILKRMDAKGVAALEARQASGKRSLAAILGWTLELLSPDEMSVLAAAAITAGFDVDLLERIVLDDALDVATAVDSLVSVGLVQPAGHVNGRSRFRLLESIRSEVRRIDLLAAQLVRLRDRHIQVMGEIGATIGKTYGQRADPKANAMMDAEADNLRMALDALDLTDPDGGLALWNDLYVFWHQGGRFSEGLMRFEDTSMLVQVPTEAYARALNSYVAFMNLAVSPTGARELSRYALDIARLVDDDSEVVTALSQEHYIATRERDAERVSEIDVELARLSKAELSIRARVALNETQVFSLVARTGASSDVVLDALFGFLGTARELGLEPARMTLNIPLIHLYRGEFAESVAAARDLLQHVSADHDRLWLRAIVATAFAELQDRQAIEYLPKSAAAELNEPSTLAELLGLAVPMAVAFGHPLIAARCWGAARGMVARGETDLDVDDEDLQDRALERARKLAPAIQIEVAIREGSDADPLELYRSLPQLLTATPSQPATKATLRHGDLTKREVEILALVGRGKNDREIAAELFISAKTASVHVANIKAKLGASSRLEIALQARDLGPSDLPR